MEFRHAPPGVGRLGISRLPHPRRGASTLSTCRAASLRRLGPLPPFPGSLVKAPLAYLLVYRIRASPQWRQFTAPIGRYAQRIMSTPGKHDGLAWQNQMAVGAQLEKS